MSGNQFHDNPWELVKSEDISLAVKIVCDVDHLWAFTRENFWQDTVRKNIRPDNYWGNLKADLNGYFVTVPGKQKALQMLEELRAEVELWKRFIEV